MKSKLLFLLMSSSVLGFSTAFAAADNLNQPAASNQAQQAQPVQQVQPAQQQAQQDPAQNSNVQKNGEAIASLIVIDKNEIAAANEALETHVRPMVKKYAHILKRDHSKNLDETLSLSKKIGINPADTDEVNTLKQKGEKQLSDLKALNPQQFQVAFIDAMVNGHQEALTLIDDKLLKDVNNPQLKQHLEQTRTTIARHLKKAQIIQNKLKANQ